MQCRLHSALHQDRMYHCLPRRYHCLRHKCMRTGLWMIPLSKDAKAPPADFHPMVAMAANIDATLSTAGYACYIHQLLCSPTAATLLLALTKSTELKTIPGLTTNLIHTHLPKSTATNKGHMWRHQATWLIMSALCRDFFPPKMTDTSTCRATCR